ncbi:methyltransferase [Thalassiella azotivora]
MLADAVDRLVRQAVPDGAARVLDLGGGTGGQAVRLAGAGHDVTVVDPSPDALAALGRRAAEAGVADRVHAVQGDAEGLGDVLEDASVDVVLCHGVLEVVDDPDVALSAVRRVLRPSGRLSLLVAQRDAAVLHRVGTGHLRQALRIASDPAGRWGADDPLQRRFDADQVAGLLSGHGLRVEDVTGVRVLADLVPRSSLDGDPAAEETLTALEARAATTPALRAVAAQLHVHAVPAGD